jgi:hypothetical protein
MESASCNFAGPVESIKVVQQNDLNEYFRLTYFFASRSHILGKKLGRSAIPKEL